MVWLGKIVGGSVGLALGGPLGAVLGATLGHIFDYSTVESYKQEYIHTTNYNSIIKKDNQMTFFVAAFSMLAKLAKADGKVSIEEINFIKKFISNDLKLRGNSKEFAFNIFKTALDVPQSFKSFANQFYSKFQNQPQILEFMLDIMIRVSLSDNHISSKEEYLLLQASDLFKFDRIKFNRLKSKYINNNIVKYYSILGCKTTDTKEILKKSYRKKVQEYHPDKISSKGLPEEFNKFAQKKFREIQEAWEIIRKDRGFK